MALAPEAIGVTHPAPALRGAAVAGLGSALPDLAVGNAAVAEAIGVSEEWILRRTGIRSRRRAAAGARLCELAAAAGAAALRDAALAPDQIDLVIVATMSPDAVTPNEAPKVAHLLGATGAAAFDLGSACAGFVSALAAATALISVGSARTALVIGAEILSRHLDPADRATAAVFGDGAGALVLGAAPDGGRFGPFVMGSDGSHSELITVEPHSGTLRMDGHETFKQAVARLEQCSQQACAAAGLGLADIDLFVFHQANQRITRTLTERLGVPAERVVDAIAELGNTSAATIPLALEHARRDGRLTDGARVLLAAVGGGFTWSAAVVEWGRS